MNRNSGSATQKQNALVLLSGGIDSSACVHFYLSGGFAVNTLFVDYGQMAADQEFRAASAIAAHYRTPHRTIRMHGSATKKTGIIQGRNAFLLFSALAEWMDKGAGVIVIGIHNGTKYPDCSARFIATVQRVFDLYCDGCIIAAAPFVGWSKCDVLKYTRIHKIPIELTYSCQLGDSIPCGKCDSCLDRKALHVF